MFKLRGAAFCASRSNAELGCATNIDLTPCVLQNAASVAGLIVTTEVIRSIPADKAATWASGAETFLCRQVRFASDSNGSDQMYPDTSTPPSPPIARLHRFLHR